MGRLRYEKPERSEKRNWHEVREALIEDELSIQTNKKINHR